MGGVVVDGQVNLQVFEDFAVDGAESVPPISNEPGRLSSPSASAMTFNTSATVIGCTCLFIQVGIGVIVACPR